MLLHRHDSSLPGCSGSRRSAGPAALCPGSVFSAAAVLLAMLPRLWPAAYAAVTQLPGLGWFRAPGRYTLVASLGLCLAAGSGLDRAVSWTALANSRLGLALAWAFALAAAGLGLLTGLRAPGFRASLGGPRLAHGSGPGRVLLVDSRRG